MIHANWAVAVKQPQPVLSGPEATESLRTKGRSRAAELDRKPLAVVNEALGCSDS